MRPRTKSDLVSAPDFWNKSIARCWSLGLGRRTCQLSQRGFSARFGSKLCFVSFFISVSGSNYDFGVIYLPFGARAFVVQTAVCVTKTHLANIKNRKSAKPNDTIEVSTLWGCLLRDITSMYYSRLQSYSEFSNISLSTTFTLFPFISLYFTDG